MTKSVALCTYNGEKYLKEQIDSILSQENPVDEIVICDDGSTDGTIAILKEYETQFPHLFQIFINSENLGYVRNFEKALSLCKNDIVFLCDQDDVWYKNKVKVIEDYFSQNSTISLVAHNLNLLGLEVGNETYWELKNFEIQEKNVSQDKLLEYVLVKGNPFPGMSLTIRKDLLKKYLPFKNIDSIIIHDYEIIIKALRDEKFGMVENILGAYRQHEAQSIGYKKKKTNHHKELTKIYLLSQENLRIKKYIESFSLNQNIQRDLQEKFNEKYSLFLKNIPPMKRFFIHLKNKYYYKLFN